MACLWSSGWAAPASNAEISEKHPCHLLAVIERVLAQPGSRSLELLAQCVGRMQFLAPMSRKLGNHVEIEDPSWSLALTGEKATILPLILYVPAY